MFQYQFKPKLLPTAAFIVILPILLSLGFWQLGRMEEKQTMLDALAQGEHNPARVFPPVQPPMTYSKFNVLGKFLPEFSVLLEHQMHNGQVGYHALTAFEVAPDLPLLWVNRGWTLQLGSEPLESVLNIMGMIYYPSENRFILGENFSYTPESILKIQRIDLNELGTHFNRPFYPYVLLLDPDSPEGFVRDWEIKTMPPSKHLGYAVQWFALAGTLIILYIFVNLQRKTKK